MKREEGILAQLVERKDITAYVTFRIQRLLENLNEDIINSDIEKDKIEKARAKVRGRIEELQRLKNVVEHHKLKEEGKKHWRSVNDNS